MWQWVAFMVAFAGLLFFSFSFVFAYSERREKAKLTRAIGVFSLFFTLLTIFVLPIDVFSISSNLDPLIGVQNDPQQTAELGRAVRYLYYSLYSTLAAIVFVLLPFGFFYYEEEDGEENYMAQAGRALKYTFVFVIILGVLLCLGFLLKRGRADSSDWIGAITKDFSAADDALAFIVGVMSIAGMIGWVSYTAFGMAWLPLKIMGTCSCPSSRRQPGRRRAVGAAVSDVASELARVQARIEYIEARYAVVPTAAWSRGDQEEVLRLRNRERQLMLVSDTEETVASRSRPSMFSIFMTGLIPFRFILGSVLLLVSLFVVYSLFITELDRMMNSPCGLQCGFLLDKAKLFNPLDWILLESSKVFPFDYFVFAALNLWLFLTTISGLVSIGVRALCIQLYEIRAQRTMQNALLMGIWFLVFVLLAINIQIGTLAPQYATFGKQQYIPSKQTSLTACDMSAMSSERCVMSQLSRFQDAIVTRMPALGNIYFFSNALFVCVFSLTLVISMFSRRRSREDYVEIEQDQLDYFA